KSTCRDDACRSACAARCGTCRQTCLREEDHCASGECSQAMVACSEKPNKDYAESDCPKLRPKLAPCVDDCVEKVNKKSKDGATFMEMRDCQSKCEERVMPGCGRFFSLYRIY